MIRTLQIMPLSPEPARFRSLPVALRAAHLLAIAAGLGIRSGCRIQDDRHGIDFRWRLVTP